MTTALVTGGSGYVASHLIVQLLERDYTVRTTVRDLGNGPKVAPLLAMQARYPGKLELFEADLLVDGSFHIAAAGADVVFHVASPFKLPEKIRDGQAEMVDPALQGTRNVLAAIDAAPSVSRLVLTSTVGAVFGDYSDVREMDDNTLTERYWNTTSTVQNNPYHYAKTLAERAAWSAAEAQDRWSMVALNPGLILGPSLTPSSESGSLFLLDELLRGTFFYGAANFAFTVVDVRDVALAHILAAEQPGLTGRVILAHEQMYSLLDMANAVRAHHRRRYLLPRFGIPDPLVRLIGPRFGLTQDYIGKHLGIRFTVDNSRSTGELAMTYRPAEQTFIDHYQAWEKQRSVRA